MDKKKSQKAVLLEKAKSSTSLIISVVAGLIVFSGLSLNALYGQMQHKRTVISEKQKAYDTLEGNVKATQDLIDAFEAFEKLPESVIGDTSKNSKIVLDALPPAYDFPALATSLEKILTDGGYTITAISGTDNETTENQATEPSVSSAPVPMDFTIGVQGEYAKLKQLLPDLERSIRPIKVKSVTIGGSAQNARITVNAQTYYQPGIEMSIQYKEIAQ